MDKYCEKCGTELIDGVCPKCVQSTTDSKEEKNFKLKQFFASPHEKLVVILGNSYLQNFLNNRTTKKGFAVVSDKRVYFQGTSYNITYGRHGKMHVVKRKQSRTVDLKDVTGTGNDNYSDIKWLVYGCIFLIIWIVLLLKIIFRI